MERLRRVVLSGLKLGAVAFAIGFVVYQLHFKPVSVDVIRGENAVVVSEVMGTGTLEAKTRARLGTRIQGRVMSVFVEQNDAVTSGQLLVVLESEDRERELARARAAKETAAAGLERVSADLARSRAVLEQAERDYQRMRLLFEQHAVPATELEKAAEVLLIAQADISRAEAAILEAQRKVEEASSHSEVQEARLAETRVHAPFDGIVVRRDVDPGDFVVPGTILLEVVSPEVFWVSAWVDETVLSILSEGQRARIVFRSEPGQSYQGAVARWNREVDRETRQFLVDVRVDELPAKWSVGQRAEVYIESARSDASSFTIPSLAVQWRQGDPGVFLIEEGRANWRPVELGVRGNDRMEVLSGVDESDAIILPSAGQRWSEGRRVSGEPRPS